MSPEERTARIAQLKDEIARVSFTISGLKQDKKAEMKGYNNAIKDQEAQLEIHLSELKELQSVKD